MLPQYHIYFDTPQGRQPFTLFVFGPYTEASVYDVEVWEGHVSHPTDPWDVYLYTISDLARDTHIIEDCWDSLVTFLSEYKVSM